MKQKIVAVSGYFDPVHVGHVEYFALAKKLAGARGKVVCILNNDRQALLKKPKIFMPLEERKRILEAIRHIDEVYVSIDEDESVSKSLEVVAPDIFANGGDRFIGELAEDEACKRLNIERVDNLGKKIQASSNLINKWRTK